MSNCNLDDEESVEEPNISVALCNEVAVGRDIHNNRASKLSDEAKISSNVDKDLLRSSTDKASVLGSNTPQGISPTGSAEPSYVEYDVALAKARSNQTSRANTPGVQAVPVQNRVFHNSPMLDSEIQAGTLQVKPLERSDRERKIQAIIKDDSLSEGEKRKRIQVVMQNKTNKQDFDRPSCSPMSNNLLTQGSAEDVILSDNSSIVESTSSCTYVLNSKKDYQSLADRQAAIQAIIKDLCLTEDEKRKKIQDIVKKQNLRIDTNVPINNDALDTVHKNDIQDLTLAKARARNTSGPAQAPGVVCVDSAHRSVEKGAVFDSSSRSTEDAACAKARSQNIKTPDTTQGTINVASYLLPNRSSSKMKTVRSTQDGLEDYKSSINPVEECLKPFGDVRASDKDQYLTSVEPRERAPHRDAYGMETHLEQNASMAAPGHTQIHSDDYGERDEYAAPSAIVAEAVTYAMDVKQILPEAEVAQREKRNVYRKWLVIAILAVCLAVPATVTGVVLGMQTSANSYTATPAPTMAPTSIEHTAYQTFLLSNGISSATDFANPKSAQNRALRWMTTIDPLKLVPQDPNFIQRYSIVALYFSTNGDNWEQCSQGDVQTHCMDGRKSPWLSATSECDWAGIGCDGNSKVVMISILYPLNMNGPLPPELASLDFLNDLSIVMQQLRGPLPPWIGKMKNLLTLRLYENQMTGSLPESLYTLPYIRNLVLRNNQFAGPISANIGNLNSLVALHISNNKLTGQIPATVAKLAGLKEFYLYNNMLAGPLPESLYSMTGVEEIVLAYNMLTGSISSSISGLRLLQKLNLRNNDLSGNIPPDLGFLLQLQELDLAQNKFSGIMPQEICYLRSFQLSQLAADCSAQSPKVECGCCTSCQRRLLR